METAFFLIHSTELKCFILDNLFNLGHTRKELAVALYYEVRDRILYNPFKTSSDFDIYSISNVLENG